jgi:hypothetical protein
MKQKSIVKNAKQEATRIKASKIDATGSKKQLQKEPIIKFGHTISQVKDQMSLLLSKVEKPWTLFKNKRKV